MQKAHTSHRRGRPRDPAVDRALALQTLRFLAHHGYDAMTLADVADAAGVSKATLYRRHRDKRSLVVSALTSLAADAPQPRDTGNLDRDLPVFAQETLHMMQQFNVFPILSALVVQAEQDPRPLNLLRRYIIMPRRKAILLMLRRAQQRKQINQRVDLELAVDTVMGSVFTRQIAGLPMNDRWLQKALQQLMAGWQK